MKYHRAFMYYPDPRLISSVFQLYKDMNDWKNMKEFFNAIVHKK